MVLVPQDIGKRKMPPQGVITSVNRNVSPNFAFIDSQVFSYIIGDPVPPPEVLSFYIQIRRVVVGLYKAILITGKDILINEYKNKNSYKICVQFIPVFTNQYQYVEFEVNFASHIKEQFDRLVHHLKYIFEVTRQLDDSPFAEIWFGKG